MVLSYNVQCLFMCEYIALQSVVKLTTGLAVFKRVSDRTINAIYSHFDWLDRLFYLIHTRRGHNRPVLVTCKCESKATNLSVITSSLVPCLKSDDLTFTPTCPS